ncbi:MAG: hypothetical protein ACAH80_10225 [Alphaproteobacteria bacterium]
MTEADELDVHALADGELSPAERKRVQALVDRDPALQRKYRQIMTQRRLLLEWAHARREAKRPDRQEREKELETVDARH